MNNNCEAGMSNKEFLSYQTATCDIHYNVIMAGCALGETIKCANAARLKNYSSPKVMPTKQRTQENKCIRLDNKREKGHLRATSEIRSFLIWLRTQQAGDLRRLAHPHVSFSFPLSRVSVPSELSFDSSFPIIPHLNVLTGPLCSPMRPCSSAVST